MKRIRSHLGQGDAKDNGHLSQVQVWGRLSNSDRRTHQVRTAATQINIHSFVRNCRAQFYWTQGTTIRYDHDAHKILWPRSIKEAFSTLRISPPSTWIVAQQFLDKAQTALVHGLTQTLSSFGHLKKSSSFSFFCPETNCASCSDDQFC